MIRRSEIFPVGAFNKPHGINGEISASLDYGVDPSATDCLVVEIDGIYVPFFIEKVRPKGADSYLITLEDIDDEIMAKGLVNREIFMREAHRSRIMPAADEEADGLYAADLIGFQAFDETGRELGKIVGINDDTANVLFIVQAPGGDGEILIPVADEFIEDISTENSTIQLSLPEGLI